MEEKEERLGAVRQDNYSERQIYLEINICRNMEVNTGGGANKVVEQFRLVGGGGGGGSDRPEWAGGCSFCSRPCRVFAWTAM